jgi:hypothetical protein
MDEETQRFLDLMAEDTAAPMRLAKLNILRGEDNAEPTADIVLERDVESATEAEVLGGLIHGAPGLFAEYAKAKAAGKSASAAEGAAAGSAAASAAGRFGQAVVTLPEAGRRISIEAPEDGVEDAEVRIRRVVLSSSAKRCVLRVGARIVGLSPASIGALATQLDEVVEVRVRVAGGQLVLFQDAASKVRAPDVGSIVVCRVGDEDVVGEVVEVSSGEVEIDDFGARRRVPLAAVQGAPKILIARPQRDAFVEGCARSGVTPLWSHILLAVGMSEVNTDDVSVGDAEVVAALKLARATLPPEAGTVVKRKRA